jgi:hypothetical protein
MEVLKASRVVEHLERWVERRQWFLLGGRGRGDGYTLFQNETQGSRRNKVPEDARIPIDRLKKQEGED